MNNHVRCVSIFAPVGYLAEAKAFDKFWIEKNENYQKKSIRNRYTILAANGPLRLSVPLKSGKNKQTKITDVEISYEDDWIDQHIKTLSAAYSSSPYFEHYVDEIEELLNERYPHLWDLSIRTTEWLLNRMGIRHNINHTQEYLGVNKEDFPATKEYYQVFDSKYGFSPGLSGLDLLFNLGPASRLYL